MSGLSTPCPDPIGLPAGITDAAPASFSRTACRGSSLVYANTVHSAGSTNTTDFWLVTTLAGHEVDSMLDVWVDDKRTTNAQIPSGGGGAVTAGPLYVSSGPTAAFYRKFGTSGQTVPAELQTAFPSDIPNTFRGRGIAYLVCRFILSKDAYPIYKSPPGNIRVLVKGKKVYDPRKDPTQASYGGSGVHSLTNSGTWEWSDCPPLCVADYLMDRKLGMNVPPAEIDWASVASAATYCDVSVPVPGGTEKRFTCNGVISTAATHGANVTAILSSMGGECTWTGGLFRIRASQ